MSLKVQFDQNSINERQKNIYQSLVLNIRNRESSFNDDTKHNHNANNQTNIAIKLNLAHNYYTGLLSQSKVDVNKRGDRNVSQLESGLLLPHIRNTQSTEPVIHNHPKKNPLILVPSNVIYKKLEEKLQSPVAQSNHPPNKRVSE